MKPVCLVFFSHSILSLVISNPSKRFCHFLLFKTLLTKYFQSTERKIPSDFLEGEQIIITFKRVFQHTRKEHEKMAIFFELQSFSVQAIHRHRQLFIASVHLLTNFIKTGALFLDFHSYQYFLDDLNGGT